MVKKKSKSILSTTDFEKYGIDFKINPSFEMWIRVRVMISILNVLSK